MESVQVEVKIELGHKASCKETLTPEGYTHDWVVFVRGPESCDISHFVDKVVFHLHESFAKPKRVLKDPPYQVAEAGYGSFFLAIEVYFKSKEEPRKLKFDYDLFLPLYGAPPIDNIRSEALTFKNLTDEFKRKLIKGGGIVTSINAVNGQHSSKKQAAKTNKKRRAQEDVSGSSSEEDTLSAVDISSSSEEDTLSAVDISDLSSLSDTGYNAERGYLTHLDSTKKQAAKTNKKRRAQEDVSDWLSSGLLTPSLEERSRGLKDWIEGKFLGSGAYGEVYMYTHRYTREVLAVKKVNIQPLYAERDANVKGLKELRNEVAILKKLRHERIVAYHQSVEKEKHLYLFMDYMTGGSLRDKIKSQRHGVLSEDLSRNYTQQILEGVCYLHSQQIVHRDIKGDNVLLDDNGDVKLADFGLARKFEKIGSKTNLVSHVGTPYWMAPEVILGKPYGRKADNWSVGCTVVEMMTGRAPLGHMEPLAAMFRVGSQTFEPESVKGASLVANNFIRVALTWDPKDRPQSHELLKHQFICGSTVIREDHEKQTNTLNREDEEKQTSTGFILVD